MKHSLYFAQDHWALLKKEAETRGVSVSRLLMQAFSEWRTSYISLPPKTQSRLIAEAKRRDQGAIDKLINRALDALEKIDPGINHPINLS